MKPNFTRLILWAAAALTLPVAVTAGVGSGMIRPATPPAIHKAVTSRASEGLRGHMYSVVPRFLSMEKAEEAFIASVDMNSGRLSPLWRDAMFAPSEGSDYLFQGGTYRAGILYVPQASYGYDSYGVVWNTMDLASGQRLSPVDFGSGDTFANPYTITYDNHADMFYGLAMDDQTDSQFVSIDPKNDFSLKYIGNIGQYGNVAALAYYPVDRSLYAFTCTNDVYNVDPSTGEMNILGTLDFPDELFVEGLAGQVAYSPLDGLFAYIYRDPYSQSNCLLYFDPETLEVFEGAEIAYDEMVITANIFFTDPFAPAEAPAQAPEMEFGFEGASLSGSVAIHIPSERFDGTLLNDEAIQAVLTVDGVEVFSGAVAPGSVREIPLTLSEGVHEASLVTRRGDDGELESPVRTQRFHTGYDAPREVTELVISGPNDPAGAVISWNPSEGSGLNFGYVDVADLHYDIYLDGEKMNDSPVAGSSFTISTDRPLRNSEVKVVAVSRGKESLPTTLKAIIGKPYTIPVSWNPTAEESELFPVVNANDDISSFYFQQTNEYQYGMTMVIGYYNDPDDWFFLPVTSYENADIAYRLAFELAGVMTTTTPESLDVWVGTAPEPSAMADCIFSRQNVECSMSALPFTTTFTVPEPGAYYVGFHLTSRKSVGARGVVVRNFKVTAESADSGKAPGEPGDVHVEPGEKGALSATVSMTLPVLDMVGNPLDASKEISVQVIGPREAGEATGLPGSRVSVTLDVETSGVTVFSVVPSNEYGEGTLRVVSSYIGLDVPSMPVNLRAEPTDDNLSLRLTWDAPPSVGLHGGYVDTETLIYPIYLVSGTSANHIGDSDKLTAMLSPDLSGQSALNITVGARNKMGTSTLHTPVREILGRPYEVPMRERFGTSAFNYSPYDKTTVDPYREVFWENTKDVSMFDCGNPVIDQGALIAYTDGPEAVTGEVSLPKATTVGQRALSLILKYWDFSEAPVRIDVAGRRAGHNDLEVIGSITPTRPLQGEWTEGKVLLPEEYLGCGWIQLRLRPVFEGTASQLFCLDEWQLFPELDVDLKMEEVEGPTQCVVGESPRFLISIVNAGYERVSGVVRTEVVGESGTVYATTETPTGMLASNQKFQTYVTVPVTGAFADEDMFTLRAVVECDDDEVTVNNSREYVVKVVGSQLPVVSDLALSEDGCALVWSKPDATHGDCEDFDILHPFANDGRVGAFTTVDLDGLEPVQLASGAMAFLWDGCMEPSAWTVVNAEACGTMNDERGAPHSGKQFLMARSVNPDLYEQASDWLISPEVKGGSTLGFWYGTLSSDVYEYVELWYSRSGDLLDAEDVDENTSGMITRMGDFHRLRSFSKYGTAAWEEVAVKLPEDARYFALRYCSYDGYAALIDDLTFEPVEISEWPVKGYSVYRMEADGSLTHVGDCDEPRFALDADASGCYCVRTHVEADPAVYAVSEGPVSNVVSVGTGSVNGLADGLRGVTGGRGLLTVRGFAGAVLTVTTPSGQSVRTIAPTAPIATYSLAPGIYLVHTPGATYKVAVR